VAYANRDANVVVSAAAAQPRTSVAARRDGVPMMAFACPFVRISARRMLTVSRPRCACANWATTRSTAAADRSVPTDASTANAWRHASATAGRDLFSMNTRSVWPRARAVACTAYAADRAYAPATKGN